MATPFLSYSGTLNARKTRDFIRDLIIWHFGRTQQFTSIGSHNIAGDENSENKDHYSQTITWLDQQAMHFTDEQDEYHNESVESDGR